MAHAQASERTRPARIEHVNISVADPDASAARLSRLFGWTVRWSGRALNGYAVHVGTEDDYVALYAPRGAVASDEKPYARFGTMNHIGVVTSDIDAAEALVRAEGLEPHSHADYEPGRRFYFSDPDGIEYEVVAYD